MSLWRVKHTLSPAVEAALVATVAAYGLFAIWHASLRPFSVSTTALIDSVAPRTSLDTDAWMRRDDASQHYAHAIPPGWLVDDRDPLRVRLGRSARELANAPSEGEGIMIESLALSEQQEIADLAADEFADLRPALYDVAVDGRPALFAVEFKDNRVVRQVVYVPFVEGAVLAVRSADADPAVFATLVSTIKFYEP